MFRSPRVHNQGTNHSNTKVADFVLCSIAWDRSLTMIPWVSKHVGIFYVI
jgi:hypothetical protein